MGLADQLQQLPQSCAVVCEDVGLHHLLRAGVRVVIALHRHHHGQVHLVAPQAQLHEDEKIRREKKVWERGKEGR